MCRNSFFLLAICNNYHETALSFKCERYSYKDFVLQRWLTSDNEIINRDYKTSFRLAESGAIYSLQNNSQRLHFSQRAKKRSG